VTITNNMMADNGAAIFGNGISVGTAGLDAYAPGALVLRNIFAGASASQYPAGNFFPTAAQWLSEFVNAAADDYRLASGSAARNAGTDGKDLGVDFAALDAAMNGSPTPPPPAPVTVPTPYGGTPAAIPGTIEAERFDEGGEGVAYHDLDATNNGGQFRTTGVDIEATTDTGGGYNVGWMRAGEWLIYSVTVATAGSYTLDARVASSGTGGTFHVEANGVNVTGTLAVPNTGAWQSWQSVTKTVTLAAGLQTLRLVVDSDGPGGSFGNVNLLRLTAATTTAPPPPTTTNLALNKPATASSTEATAYVASAATDGNTGTRWSSAFTDPQWIQVDLGGAASIQRVVLRWEDAYGRAYQVQVSADAQTWTTIASTTTGDGGVDDLPVSGSGRYVRVYGTVRGTPWGYSLWELEVYGTTSSTAPPPAGPQPVTWTQLVRSTASGSTLTKTSGCDGCADAGAVSQQTITSGDGYVEFTAGDATKLRIIGLSNGNTGTATQDIAFGISLTSGYAEVREQNVYRTDTRYTASDVFRIAVEAGTVKYYKNGALWYTRSAAPSYPLLVDTSLLSLNATLSNVVISGR
jgi:carbohydrate binding protein with CBM6 domain/F5/8 type C domain-containing protein